MEQKEMRMQMGRKGLCGEQGGQEAGKAEGKVPAGATKALVSL